MVSIVGKNGAGKSTLAKLICGFEKLDSGEIIFNGADISKDTIKQRAERIGMVMQNPNQMISKHMIYDEVAFGLQLRGLPEPEIKERVEHTLKNMWVVSVSELAHLCIKLRSEKTSHHCIDISART